LTENAGPEMQDQILGVKSGGGKWRTGKWRTTVVEW